MLLGANLDDPSVMIRSVSCFGPAESLARCRRCYSRYRYARIAFFVLAAIGSASLTPLDEISLAYLLFPSASFPTQRENQTAASNLLLGDRRVKTWPFHSTTVAPSSSRLRTVAPTSSRTTRNRSSACHASRSQRPRFSSIRTLRSSGSSD